MRRCTPSASWRNPARAPLRQRFLVIVRDGELQSLRLPALADIDAPDLRLQARSHQRNENAPVAFGGASERQEVGPFRGSYSSAQRGVVRTRARRNGERRYINGLRGEVVI